LAWTEVLAAVPGLFASQWASWVPAVHVDHGLVPCLDYEQEDHAVLLLEAKGAEKPAVVLDEEVEAEEPL
jgi:hypothetical protein